jgi:EmrB/QacA subfamily drug resistance transporter
MSRCRLQWVITAYALTFGGFLLLGGRVADLFGRKRTLLAGMGAFTTISLLIGVSQSPAQLIVLRALQGLAAAFMSPAALSIVLVTFREAKERNLALTYWTLVATGGAALGLLLGGVLTQYFGWRWNFFINVPIGVIVSLLIARIIPASESEEQKKGLDISGALFITTSLILQVLAFSQAPSWGWTDRKTIGILSVAALLLAGFLVNESVVKRPLMPLSIFRKRNVRGANLIMAPVYATLLGSFFLLTLYIQGVLHFSPVLTGLAFLPFPIVLALVSSRMPKLVQRYGFKPFLVIGPLVIAAGLLWASRLHANSGYLLGILPGTIIMPIGVGLTFMPLIAAATTGVPADESGIASGLITTSQQMGGALGLAILSGVAASVAASNIHLGFTDAAIQGYHAAFLVAVGFMALASLTALIVIRGPRKQAGEIQEPERASRLETPPSH